MIRIDKCQLGGKSNLSLIKKVSINFAFSIFSFDETEIFLPFLLKTILLVFVTSKCLAAGGKLWEMRMESSMVPFQSPNGAYL